MRALLGLGLVLALAGCTLLPAPAGPRDVAGRTEGYDPTAAFLKVHVRDDNGNVTLVDFDRRAWAVSEIADRLDERNITFLSVHAQPREILSEVLVETVHTPRDLDALNYDSMHATAQQRAFYDARYDELLQRVAGHVPSTPTISTPTVALTASTP